MSKAENEVGVLSEGDSELLLSPAKVPGGML